jgi:hypothetical protein
MQRNYFIAAVVIVLAAGGGAVHAIVGGPTYIYDFRYNPADESVYYVNALQGGRGCPPVLVKQSIVSGALETVVSCEQGEALLAKSGPTSRYPAPLMQKFDELTGFFERLKPVNLPESGVAIALNFVRTENYSPEINEVMRTHFLASVHRGGEKISEFPVAGCSRKQPFTFAGYTIPGVEDALVLLSSAKSSCFEGGYIGESLYVIQGVSDFKENRFSTFWKGNEPLVPSEATLVVFEKDGIAEAGRQQIISHVVVALVFALLGVILGRKVLKCSS